MKNLLKGSVILVKLYILTCLLMFVFGFTVTIIHMETMLEYWGLAQLGESS